MERKQPSVKIINIPVGSVANPVGAGKRRFDPVDSVKATHRVIGQVVSEEKMFEYYVNIHV